MHVLVQGADGFIGSRFSSLYSQKELLTDNYLPNVPVMAGCSFTSAFTFSI